METTVELLSCTKDPLDTLALVWYASRSNDPLPPPVRDEEGSAPLDQHTLLDLVGQIMHAHIPVAEMVDFVFLLDGVPISLREQLVRHRIGVKVGPRLGADMVPQLADSSWWSQSMRVLDMGAFAKDKRYIVPETIATKPKQFEDPMEITPEHGKYISAMNFAQSTYKQLVAAGIPREDARNVIPLGATHRLVWKLNLASLIHIVGKRGCWILQLGLWKPVIEGMIEELATKVHPIFRELISPPCMKGDDFGGCEYCLDNCRRVQGEDEIPPCPLFLHHHTLQAVEASKAVDVPVWVIDQEKWSPARAACGTWKAAPDREARMRRMQIEYAKLWDRNVNTGARL